MSAFMGTPGPLSVDPVERGGGYQVSSASGRGVGFAIQRDEHPSIGHGISHKDALANAHMFAAAQEMLEALAGFIAAVEDDGDPLPGTRFYAEYVAGKAAFDKALGARS